MSVQLQTVKQSRKPGCNRVSQESRCPRLFLHPAAVLLSLSALPYWRNTLICTGAAHVLYECPRPNSHMYQGILTRKPFTMLYRLLNPNLLSLCSKMSRWMRNYKKRCNSHVVCLFKDVLQLCFTSAEQKPSWLSLFAPSFCVVKELYKSFST